jgi:CHAD domain-containing protein
MILEQNGCKPENWTAKPACQISPSMTIRDAIRNLATASLETCRRCEAGIMQDIDTEFLHDYRVSLRRLRSTLKLVKHVYPPDTTKLVLGDLAAIARRTNRLRDLDVCLLRREEYISSVPPELVDALEGMFVDLEQDRFQQQKAVAEQLQTQLYRERMRRLGQVFDESRCWPISAHSHLLTQALAGRVLAKRYRRMCRDVARLRVKSTDQQIHDLRLEAKKLRYLLEFFGDLYPNEEVIRLTKKLRKLQNVLGDFNDLSVQKQFLLEYLQDQVKRRGESTSLALGVGCLLGILHRRQIEVREKLDGKLTAFTAMETRTLVGELLETGRRAA